MNPDNDMRSDAPKLQPRGQGHMSLFLCGECNSAKPLLGRKLRFVRKLGLRSYVCAGCNETMVKARAK